MKKIYKRIAILLCCALMTPSILSCIPSVQSLSHVEAAAKAKLGTSKGTIGIESSPEYLWINNMNYEAQYTFSSKNNKTATVSQDGLVLGVKKGNTSIVVKESYKGKTTTVGTYKVDVVPSKLGLKKVTIELFNDRNINYISNGKNNLIDFRNYSAKYTLTPKDKSIVTINKYGDLKAIKPGTTTVTVTETYKKVKRKLGAFTVTVTPPTIKDKSKSVTLGLNSSKSLTSLINFKNLPYSPTFSCVSANKGIVSVKTEKTDWDENIMIKGVSVGTTELTIYIKDGKQKYEIGKTKVTVKEIPCTEFKFDPYAFEINEDDIFTKTYYLGEDDYNSLLTQNLIIKPEDTSTANITFKSSNESIVTVDNKGKITTHDKGSAIITATLGSFSDKIEIIVKNYDEYADDSDNSDEYVDDSNDSDEE